MLDKTTIFRLNRGLITYFYILFTARRNFIPILSVYYLTLPNATATQIGIYTGIGYIASFFLNVPAGKFADRFGYRKTLILTKIFLIGSSFCFLFWHSFSGFLVGAILSSLGADAFMSGTGSSFLRDTLVALGRKSEYKKVSSAMRANVSLLSIAFIVGLPFLTIYDIRFPLAIGLAFDITGLIASFFLPSPPKEGGEIMAHNSKNIITLAKETRGTAFVPLALFSSVIAGCLLGDSVFRIPYLISLGYPLTLAGVVMGASRFVWFLVGHNIERLERIFTAKSLMLFDIIVFSSYYLLAAAFSNPYFIAIGFIIGVGYFWGRSEIYNDLLFEHIRDPRYKATMLSLRSQITNIVQIIIAFGLGIVMTYSYRLGFAIIGVILLISLSVIYVFGILPRLGELEKVSNE